MNTLRRIFPAALLLFTAAVLTAPCRTAAHEAHQGGKGDPDPAGVELQEKTGLRIAGDAVFTDENGMKAGLAGMIGKPTVILPVYYTCTSACGIMLANLARAANDVPLILGKEYDIIALSFDSTDSPATARKARENYLAVMKTPPPPGSWRFLTGHEAEIQKFTRSIGFAFRKAGKGGFIHPNTLVVVSHDGTIIRYLAGPSFLPFDIAMALTEAERGTPSLSIRKMLSYCFTYESEKKTYTLRGVKIISGVILLGMGIFLFFILRKKKTTDG